MDTPLAHASKFQYGRIWRGGVSVYVCVVGVGGPQGCLEVVQWGGETVGMNRNRTWIWKGGNAWQWRSRGAGLGGGWGGAGFAPLMKIRSVFGTCMVSGIRRREKVREWDGRSSRRGGSGGEGGEGGGGVVLSDGSKGLEKSVWHPGRIEEDNSSWKWL